MPCPPQQPLPLSLPDHRRSHRAHRHNHLALPPPSSFLPLQLEGLHRLPHAQQAEDVISIAYNDYVRQVARGSVIFGQAGKDLLQDHGPTDRRILIKTPCDYRTQYQWKVHGCRNGVMIASVVLWDVQERELEHHCRSGAVGQWQQGLDGASWMIENRQSSLSSSTIRQKGVEGCWVCVRPCVFAVSWWEWGGKKEGAFWSVQYAHFWVRKQCEIKSFGLLGHKLLQPFDLAVLVDLAIATDPRQLRSLPHPHPLDPLPLLLEGLELLRPDDAIHLLILVPHPHHLLFHFLGHEAVQFHRLPGLQLYQLLPLEFVQPGGDKFPDLGHGLQEVVHVRIFHDAVSEGAVLFHGRMEYNNNGRGKEISGSDRIGGDEAVDAVEPVAAAEAVAVVGEGDRQFCLGEAVTQFDDQAVLVHVEAGPDLLDVGDREGTYLVFEGLDTVGDHHLPEVPPAHELRTLQQLPGHHEAVHLLLPLPVVDLVPQQAQLLHCDPGEEEVDVVEGVVLEVDLEFQFCLALVFVGEPDAALVVLVEHLHLGDLGEAEPAPAVDEEQLAAGQSADRLYYFSLVVDEATQLGFAYPPALLHQILLLAPPIPLPLLFLLPLALRDPLHDLLELSVVGVGVRLVVPVDHGHFGGREGVFVLLRLGLGGAVVGGVKGGFFGDGVLLILEGHDGEVFSLCVLTGVHWFQF